MSEMPQWFAWFLVGCGFSVFAVSMLYVRQVLRFRKSVREFEWPRPDDSVSMAVRLINNMDEKQLRELSSRAGAQLRGGRGA